MLVLALALAGCERDHVNAYDIDEEEIDKKEPEKEDGGNDGDENSDPYEEPNEAKEDDGRKALIVAERLSGSWNGSLDVDFFDDAGFHYTGSYTSQMDFAQYNSNTVNGTGMETDYDAGGKMVLKAPFTWYVDTAEGNAIYMKFDYREMVVRSYSLDYTHFSGTMRTTDSLETDHFSFTRVK
jgi:hypothetical protein